MNVQAIRREISDTQNELAEVDDYMKQIEREGGQDRLYEKLSNRFMLLEDRLFELEELMEQAEMRGIEA